MQKLKNNNYKEVQTRMSIQINLDGLSFCVFNGALAGIEQILYLPFSENFELDFQNFINENKILTQPFEQVKAVYHNHIFSFVPKAFFSSVNLYQYLKFNTDACENLPLRYQEISEFDAVNVFSVEEKVTPLLQKQYGAFLYEHFSYALLKVLLLHNQKFKEKAIYAHFEKNVFYLSVLEEGKLLFFNHFFFENEMDMLYYLLFSLEQLGIDTEEVPIFLLGEIFLKDVSYQLIYKYIRYVHFLTPQKNNPFCQNVPLVLASQNFVLTHSF